MGCHIITSPENIIGDKNHKWGRHPLHFCKNYYDYAYKALNIIINSHDRFVENEKLTELFDYYSHLFNEIYNYYENKVLKNELTNANMRADRAEIYYKSFYNIIKNKEIIIKNIIELCKSKQIKSVAFWGDFLISSVLADLLKQAGIKLDYIICNWNHGTSDLVIPVKAAYPETDAIIVCDVLAIEKRTKYINSKISCQVLPVFDFIPYNQE